MQTLSAETGVTEQAGTPGFPRTTTAVLHKTDTVEILHQEVTFTEEVAVMSQDLHLDLTGPQDPSDLRATDLQALEAHGVMVLTEALDLPEVQGVLATIEAQAAAVVVPEATGVRVVDDPPVGV
ncbi:MAG: hypothetical protein HKO11_09710 [Eudoraea sp.]|nr:hypothetical protein [Eudoraea sp.]